MVYSKDMGKHGLDGVDCAELHGERLCMMCMLKHASHPMCPHLLIKLHCMQMRLVSLKSYHQILSGMLEDSSLVTEPKVEALLSCLVEPTITENPAAADLARSVLRRREHEVQPTLQRLLTRLLTSPLTASSGLWEQSYAVVAQVRWWGAVGAYAVFVCMHGAPCVLAP